MKILTHQEYIKRTKNTVFFAHTKKIRKKLIVRAGGGAIRFLQLLFNDVIIREKLFIITKVVLPTGQFCPTWLLCESGKVWNPNQLLTCWISTKLGILQIPLIEQLHSINTWSQWYPDLQIYKCPNLTVTEMHIFVRGQRPKIFWNFWQSPFI